MIERRKFLIGLAALYAAHARAQAPERAGKPVRVGILELSTRAKRQVQEKTFIGGMRELGWEEGRNISYDRVYADDDEARLPALAAELVARDPNLIHVLSNPATLAAFAKTRTIPIVFSAANDPVEIGSVKSLAHPGGNVTGVANISWELGGKRLQLLKQAMPKVARVGVLVHPLRWETAREQKLIEQAGATLRVTVIPVRAKQAGEFDAAFASLVKCRAEALLTTHIGFFMDERKRILDLAARRRIPVVGHRSQLADDGALISYSALITDQIRRAAQLVDKILKGAKPADIPIEQPTKFELVVNMKTAKALGITIPGEILLQAMRVIE